MHLGDVRIGMPLVEEYAPDVARFVGLQPRSHFLESLHGAGIIGLRGCRFFRFCSLPFFFTSGRIVVVSGCIVYFFLGRIGVVFALGIEAGGFVDTLDNVVSTRADSTRIHSGDLHGIPVAVLETGVGCSRAREAVRQLLDARKLNWIVSAGFAGSLTAELPRGDFLIADSLVNDDGGCLSLDLHMYAADTPGLHVGRLLTIATVVALGCSGVMRAIGLKTSRAIPLTS